MSANVYARIAERYHVPASDEEAIERFFLDVAPTLSREEREAILAELLDAEGVPAPFEQDLPVDVPTFAIAEAPPIRQTSVLAQLVGDLSAAFEQRVREQIDEAIAKALVNARQHDYPFAQLVRVFADLQDNVRSAVQRMTEANVGVVAVRDHERLVGLLSEHDVVVRVVAEGLDPDETSVGSVMTPVN